MRSVFLVIIAVVLLVGGFFVYYATQSTTSIQPASDPRLAMSRLPVEVPETGDAAAGGVAGPGTDVWIQSFDEKTNRVAFQFRASRYEPQPEGPVNVTNPQAELFTGNDDRQLIRIEGKTGRVVMPSTAAQRGEFRGNEASAPRRGELHDVTITLFDESDLTRPLMVCRVNNIAFDNDTFRIATEAYHDGAREVPDDEVPIEVRGEDFDFDGRGLVIRWNEADRRLQLLEIAHGERLVIKSPEMLRAFDHPAAAPKAPSTGQRTGAAPAGSEEGVVLASMQEEAGTAPEAPAKTESPAPSQPPVYRASFRDAVRITRGEAVLGSADQMLVDFISGKAEPVSTPRGGKRKADADEPVSTPLHTDAAHAQRQTPAPAAAPEVANPLEPVVVRWSGKLRVTALEVDSPRPAPGSLNIAMSSEQQPVVLNHRGLDVRCASFDYRSGDDSLTVTSSKVIPIIELKLADGTIVHTPSIVYNGVDSQAELRGPSRAQLPLPVEGNEPPQWLNATWETNCVLTLLSRIDADGAQELRPERAVFNGKVQVDHPQLALRSDALELSFDPADDAAQPAPNELKASGSVHFRLVDSSGNRENIHCDELVATVAPIDANGELAPKTFTAEGNVVATNEDGELRAGHLTVAMAPVRAPAPVLAPARARAPAKEDANEVPKPQAAHAIWGGGDFEIDSITAQREVKLSLRAGGGATAEQVHMNLTPEGAVARLLGQPATLSDGTSTLSGPHITYEQGAQKLAVQGSGTLVSTVRDAPDQPARPVEISWEKSLHYDGMDNLAEISGKAQVTADAADGSRQIASSDRIVIALMDAPAELSIDAPAPAPQAGRGEAFGGVDEKVVRTITLAGDAQVQSILFGSGPGAGAGAGADAGAGAEAGEGAPVRRIHLLAPEIIYDVEQQRAEVPSAGRMLVQDTLPAREAQGGNPLLGGFRGATAFQWAERLVLDQSAGRITMSGSVLIVHQDPQSPDQSFRLEAQRVSADLLERESRESREKTPAAPHPAAADAGAVGLFGSSELHLKALSATGEIRLNSPQIQLDAHEMVYDAVTELLTARGSERVPVELYREPGISRGSFQEVIWNARTEQIQLREVQAQVRR